MKCIFDKTHYLSSKFGFGSKPSPQLQGLQVPSSQKCVFLLVPPVSLCGMMYDCSRGYFLIVAENVEI